MKCSGFNVSKPCVSVVSKKNQLGLIESQAVIFRRVSRMRVEIYKNALKLIQEASKLGQNSKTKFKLINAAIVILWNLVEEGKLETPMRWDAQLLLIQQIILYTTSFQQAVVILRYLKGEALTPEYECRCKLLQVEMEIRQKDPQRALRLSDQLLDQLETVDSHGLFIAFLFQRMRLGPVSKDMIDKVKDVNAKAMLMILSQDIGGKYGVTSPDIVVMNVISRLMSALKHGIEEDDVVLVEELKNIDWSTLWPNGQSLFVANKELIQMTSGVNNNEIMILFYVVLTIFHFSLDDGDCASTKSWLSELLQHVSSTAVDNPTLATVYFYAVLIYHQINKPSARDILLEQMVELGADEGMVEFCRGVIYQQTGDSDQARKSFDIALTQNSTLRPGILLNLLCMAPNSVSHLQRLAALDLTAPQQNTLKLITCLVKPDSMTSDDHEKAIDSLKASEMSSPLERALVALLKPGDHKEDRLESYKQAISAFETLGMNDWKEYAAQRKVHIS